MEEKKRPFWKSPALIRCVLLVCFAGIFIFVSVKLGIYFLGSKQEADVYDEMVSIKESIVQQQQAVGDSSSEESAGSENVMLPEYRHFYDMNPDMVGWLQIPDTRIDYPVMQTVETPDYYLKRNFYKKASDWGAIYAREACNVNLPSDNVVLYGHAMKDGSMFATLNRYATKAYWQEHQKIFFDTLYEHREYQVWAVFKTSAQKDEGFPYHRYNDFSDEEAFDYFVNSVKELSFFDTGITPKYGDKLLTLSTCEYTLEDGRFVVCAVKIS